MTTWILLKSKDDYVEFLDKAHLGIQDDALGDKVEIRPPRRYPCLAAYCAEYNGGGFDTTSHYVYKGDIDQFVKEFSNG